MISDEGQTVAVGSSDSSASGPSYCKLCGEWPARQTAKGLRCHLCECRDICADNPVPLPEGRDCLQDLASIGVPGAAQKLALLPNVPDQATEGVARRSDEAKKHSTSK